jgi:hypothetical protein
MEKLMWELYEDYEEQMKMEEPFELAVEFLSQFPAPPQPMVQPVFPAQTVQPAVPAQPLPSVLAAQIPPHMAHLFPPGVAPVSPQITDRAVAKLAYVESASRSDVLTMDYRLSGSWQPNGAVGVMFLMLRQGWTKE